MDTFDSRNIPCFCSDPAEFVCDCKAQTQYFCSKCVTIHIKDTNFLHKLKSIINPVNEPSRLALINFLKLSLNNISLNKASISAKMHQIFLTLQEHTNTALKDLSFLHKSIKSLLKILKNFLQNACELNIKKMLHQNPIETKKKLIIIGTVFSEF